MKAALRAAIDRSPAPYTDIRIERRWRTAVTVLERRIESATTTRDQHATVRCLSPLGGWGIATCDGPDTLTAAVQRAWEHALALGRPDRPVTLAPVPPRQLELTLPPDRDPRAIPFARKTDLALAATALLRGADRRITGCRARYTDSLTESWVATSEGALLSESRPELALAVLAAAEEAGTVEQALGSRAVPGTWEELEDWAAGVAAVAARAVDRLHAMRLQPGRMTALLSPRAAGLLAHRVAAHLCHADAGEEGMPPAPVGTRLGSEVLTIGDDGTALGLGGTLAFDHEGTPPQNTTLIRNGVVVHHVHTRTTAGREGTAATGNARGPAAGAPAARLTNSYVASGKGDLADLLRDVHQGIYLDEPVAVAVDEGQVLVRAGFARMIRRGELAEPVKGAALSGDVATLLTRVDRVGGDFAWDQSAARCRRGRHGAVPVSVGAPHLRLTEVPIGEVAR